MFIHGYTQQGSPALATYHVWYNMVHRCVNPNNAGFPRYGGRGIQVCERWRNSFDNFLSDMGLRPDGLGIERIDNDGNYEPSNCCWANRKEQQRNMSRNRNLTHRGITRCVAWWVEQTGLKYTTVMDRLKRGWSIERTLTTLVNQR